MDVEVALYFAEKMWGVALGVLKGDDTINKNLKNVVTSNGKKKCWKFAVNT